MCDPFSFLDTEHILYAAGRRIIITGFKTREMTFLPEYENKLKRVLALQVSPNKKYLAVVEVLEAQNQVVCKYVLQ